MQKVKHQITSDATGVAGVWQLLIICSSATYHVRIRHTFLSLPLGLYFNYWDEATKSQSKSTDGVKCVPRQDVVYLDRRPDVRQVSGEI